MSPSVMLLIVALTAATGAMIQRLSGMGFGLLSVPVLVVVLGPVDGVLVVNALAVINAALTTWTVRQFVDWAKFRIIAPALFVGAFPGVWLIRVLQPAPLQITVGVLLLVALAVVIGGARFFPPVEGKIPAVIGGLCGGFMNTIAAVAGPAITVYAQAARWPHATLAATLQPLFVVSGAVSFMLKILLGAGSVESVNPCLWPAAVAGMFIGIATGAVLSRYVPRQWARRVALVVAGSGGLAAVVRGVVSLG
ncbi:TSUP family transporter [Corynebacterium mendelii]|uniref:Probable membrane transporter protein n=1 Tax=Corynebacterium mendelii TaxID=2765362 RepID=A0A939DZT5_9CORY|nr:TSUP family transporter [Corynebacterium mendelii]MBN9643844.1 sulfite exporter TauE/SafE family protein [Corynebacterium mendelii]